MFSIFDASLDHTRSLDWLRYTQSRGQSNPRKVVKNPNSATYKPNSERECARRLRQMIKPQLREIYGALLADGSASLRAENGVSNT